MKKVKVFLVGILTLVLSLFCLVGCGPAGTYKFESLTVGALGFEKTYEVGQEYNGEELTKDYFTLELKDDGTAVIGDDGETFNCQWTEGEDGTITFKQNGLTLYTATIDGSTMTVKVGDTSLAGMTLILKKGLF